MSTLGRTVFHTSKPSRLLEATVSGDTQTVASLLRSGERPDKTFYQPDGSATSPFFEALKSKNETMIEIFLKANANPNKMIGPEYGSPLSYLIGLQNKGEEIDPRVFELLLKAGADPFKRVSRHFVDTTPFKMLGTDRSRKFTDLFWKYRSDVNRAITDSDGSSSTPLFEAINSNDKKLVVLLLKEKADPNVPMLNKYSNSLTTPLYAAIQKGDLELVDLLLKAGANPNQGRLAISFGSNTTETPLHLAITHEDPKLVELLLKAGAKPNEIAHMQEPENPKDDSLTFDATPLYETMGRHSNEIVSLLLRYGADPNQKSRIDKTHFETPLFKAIARGESEPCIRLLLAAGADPLQPSGKFQSTPIDLSIAMDKRSLTALLLTRAKPSKINVKELADKAQATAPTWVQLPSKHSEFTEFDDVLSIPHEKVAIKTRWIGSLHTIARDCVDAVYAASNPFITPIAGYLDKGVKEKQPRVLRFLPENSGISELGYFNPNTKDIVLRVFDKGDIDALIKKGKISADAFFPTYVHETYHAMIDATALRHDVDFFKRVKLAAEADVLALQKKGWPCDSLIKSHLNAPGSAYSTDQQLEEYIVRIPQMIVELQQKNKCTWQEAAALVKQAIPVLYKLVEEEALPRFNRLKD